MATTSLAARRGGRKRGFVRANIGALAALAAGGCCNGHFGNSLDAPSGGPTPAGASVVYAVAGGPPATRRAPDLSDRDTPAAAHWAAIARIIGRPGVEQDGVYTVTVPRDDWDVGIEGMPVPAGAGIASVFHFYRCPCGKTNVVGQFCVADYELNDVIDALRADRAERIEVASIGPMLLHSRINPQLVRFQAEGQTEPIARALREALRWTGRERMAPDAPPAR